MKRILFLCFFGIANVVAAQNNYCWVLDTLRRNSPVFRSLLSQYQAEKVNMSVRHLFDDPTIEAGFFGGSPNEIGHRWDLSVSQSFDMPSVYINKNRSFDYAGLLADNNYEIQLVQLLYKAQTICSEIVYYNALIRLYSCCVDNAQRMSELYKKRFDVGDCSILDYNRVQMVCSEMSNQLAFAQTERNMAYYELTALNGGVPLSFNQDYFVSVEIPDSVFLMEVDSVPQLKLLYNQIRYSSAEVSVARSQWLPKVSLGYASENIVGESFRGVTIGLNVPLWQQKGTVKAAKASYTAAQQNYHSAYLEFVNHQQGLLQKAKSLQQSYNNSWASFNAFNSEQLLFKALDAGEISLEDYLQSVNFYYDAQLNMLNLQHELDRTLLEFYAPYLK